MRKKGARIIMACRDLEKAERAQKEIMENSGNQNIVIRNLDLSDTKSIREFAEVTTMVKERALHILINNAGIMMCPYSKTADGFEIQFGVNHLVKEFFISNFLLTFLLIVLLKRSAPSRIINLSSMIKYMGNLTYFCVSLIVSSDTGVTAYAVHPGIVRTELKRHMNLGLLIIWKIVRPFTKTPGQGAQTTIYCAVQPELDKESAARDDEMAEKLWNSMGLKAVFSMDNSVYPS
uniref:Si:dkey-94e7.2 n=1 Tax=Cyprinus carpio TaxID=7962 RepID=A0A8C1NMG7_CYPCA